MSRRSTGGRIRAAIFFFISLGAAIVASLVIFLVINSYNSTLKEAADAEETSTTMILVAKANLGQGTTITEEDLHSITFPPEFIPDDVLQMEDEAMGRVPRERILKDEFIRRERLADPEAGIGLPAIIPRGMRALAININTGSSVSGFLEPGNYVDVIVTVPGTDEMDATTQTLLQAVTVLAVNERLGSGSVSTDKKYKPSVTLALTPDQVMKMTHAMEESSVTLTLRNDIDVTQVTTHGAITDTLLGGNDEESADKRITIKEWRQRTSANKDRTITIIHGSEERVEKIP